MYNEFKKERKKELKILDGLITELRIEIEARQALIEHYNSISDKESLKLVKINKKANLKANIVFNAVLLRYADIKDDIYKETLSI